MPGSDDSQRTPSTRASAPGFAPAAEPTANQTVVHTDEQGLDCGPLSILVGHFAMPAYCARPQGVAECPIMLVVSEIFGLHEHIADVARRFAKRGFLAIAPDLFARQGDPLAYTAIDKLVADVVEKVPDAQVMRDLDAAVHWASSRGGDTRRLGVTGFCWGGRITWLYAAHQPRLRAGVAWYGKLRMPPTKLKPRHPVDIAAELHAPVLGLYGGLDQSIPMEAVEAMRSELSRGSPAAKESRLVVYPDAGHAFHADYRPSYRAADAQDGWERCLEWFARHGVAP